MTSAKYTNELLLRCRDMLQRAAADINQSAAFPGIVNEIGELVSEIDQGEVAREGHRQMTYCTMIRALNWISFVEPMLSADNPLQAKVRRVGREILHEAKVNANDEPSRMLRPGARTLKIADPVAADIIRDILWRLDSLEQGAEWQSASTPDDTQ